MTTTILLLAANPKETDSLRLSEEFREIKECLKLSMNEDNFKVVQGEAVRPKDLRRLVLETRPQIIHFSGHGSKAGIFLENMLGKSQPVSGRALASLFKLFDSVHCVVLNACYSQTQAEAIVKVIPFVVGMKKPIGDRAAIQFSTGFYDGLGARLDIESAFQFGVNAIELNAAATQDNNRSFEIDGEPSHAPEAHSETPLLLKSAIVRPLSVEMDTEKDDDKDTNKKERKWSLNALLSLPLFKIGLSLSITLVLVATIAPILFTQHQQKDDNVFVSASEVAKSEGAQITAAAPLQPAPPPPAKTVTPKPSSPAGTGTIVKKIKNDHYKLEVLPRSLVLFSGTGPKLLNAKVLKPGNNLAIIQSKNIQWKVADPSIVGIQKRNNNNRVVSVKGLKKGSTKIYVKTGELIDIIPVTVH